MFNEPKLLTVYFLDELLCLNYHVMATHGPNVSSARVRERLFLVHHVNVNVSLS